MTSQGAGEPLTAYKNIDAASACMFHGNVRIIAENSDNEILSGIYNGDGVIYKYIDFREGVSSFKMRIKTITGGRIVLSADKPWYKMIASYEYNGHENKWQVLEFPVETVEGIYSLWIQCYGSEGELFEIEWFHFNRQTQVSAKYCVFLYFYLFTFIFMLLSYEKPSHFNIFFLSPDLMSSRSRQH
ncbi:MAG TPA: hypothetical protein DEQ09_04175 [Bacteroidales bacterium]|nr:hypothetical protein [Bacteroidales bacterium]